MNRYEFVNILKKVLKHYSIRDDQYIISSGGALLMYGLRESSRDIDISVCKEIWDTLIQRFPVTSYGDQYPLVIHTFLDGIEVEFYADFDKVRMQSELIDNVRVLHLEGVLYEKENRIPQTDKDRCDIAALKMLLCKRGI